MDDENRIALQNPVLIVLLGNWEKGIPEKLQKRFDFPGSIVYVHVHNSSTAAFHDDRVIEICYGSDWKWIFEEDQKNRITEALYLTKRQRYPLVNSIDVCILKKGEETDSVLSQTIDLIASCTKSPFLGNVFLDIYSWVDERSVQKYGRSLFEKVKILIKDEDSVRFLFLLSQMDSEDVYMEKEEELLELTMNSMLLLNCGHFPIYKQLNLKAIDSNIRIFKLGCRKLALNEGQIKNLIKYRLLRNIKEWRNGKSRENGNDSLNLRELKHVIQGQVLTLYHGLGGICFYEKNIRALEKRGNVDLCYCFGNNHERYIEVNKDGCMENSLQFTRQFCRTQLPAYLNHLLEKSGGSYLVEDDILGVKKSALEQCFKPLFSDDYSVEMVAYPSKLKSHLLEQWAKQRGLKLMQEIYARCLQEIRDGICTWSRQLNSGRKEIEAFYQRVQYDCIEINLEGSHLKNKLARYSEEMIDIYLKHHNSSFISNSYERIWRMMNAGNMEKGSIERMIEEQAEQVFVEFLKDYSVFGQITPVTEDIQERQKFYDTIYEEFLEEGKFQIRGRIPNAEVYSCYMGNLKKEFAEYINQKQPDLVYYTDRVSEPLVLYYQNMKELI